MEKLFTVILETLEQDRALMAKQVAKLAKLVDSAAVLHQKELLPSEPESDTTFLIVPREQILELIEELKFKTEGMRIAINASLAPSNSSGLERWISEAGDE